MALSWQAGTQEAGLEDLGFEARLGSTVNIVLKIIRAGEMSQQLRALAAFPEDPGSIPSTHMVAHSHL